MNATLTPEALRRRTQEMIEDHTIAAITRGERIDHRLSDLIAGMEMVLVALRGLARMNDAQMEAEREMNGRWREQSGELRAWAAEARAVESGEEAA